MLLKHLRIIRIHRREVRKMCFKMGIPIQGILHDLSKYSLCELKIHKYYSGTRSPHQNSREAIGYSESWLYHYHKNKHHSQFWMDDDEFGKFIPIKMPYKYVIEMFCDIVGAGRTYSRQTWTTASPLEYYMTHKKPIHKETDKLITLLFKKLNECENLKDFVKYYKKNRKELKTNYDNQGIRQSV